ncbi:unnamed protein product [Arctogadus glacialis]
MPGFGGMQIDIRYLAAALGLPGRQPCHDIRELITSRSVNRGAGIASARAMPDFNCFLGQTSPARPVYALEQSRGWGIRSRSREEDKTQASVPSAGVIVGEGRWTEHNPLGRNRTMEPQLNMSSVCQLERLFHLHEAAYKREPGAILTEYGIQQCDYRARWRLGPTPLHPLQRIREKGKVVPDRCANLQVILQNQELAEWSCQASDSPNSLEFGEVGTEFVKRLLLTGRMRDGGEQRGPLCSGLCSDLLALR